MGKVVLVTGVSRDLGRRFARYAATDPAIDRVIGVDVVPPRGDIGDVSFVRADIRNPVIAKVIGKEDVDTVVHMSVIATPGSAGGRGTMMELNVIGTMQLLAACQQAPGLKHLVVKSSSTVYGASSRDPAMFTEDMNPKRLPRSGYAKDAFEIEGYVRGFAPPPPRRAGHHAPRRQRDRPARDQPDDVVLPAPGDPTGAGLRPAAAVPARGRPVRGAAPLRARRRARHVQRGRRRSAHAVPGDPDARAAVGADARLRGRGARARAALEPGWPTSLPSSWGC